MKRIIIVVSVLSILMVSVVAAVAVPELLNPSADPVAFIAAHKGGAAPNYYVEPTSATYLNSENTIGPDGYDYFGEFYGGLFWIDSRLSALVSESEFNMYTDEIFAGSFDFNQRSFCRYFGITQEQYEEAISILSNYYYYGDAGQYIVEKYPVGVFGTYEDFIGTFVREEYRCDYKTEECMPSGDCVHTYTYHTISNELIEYVGDIGYATFKEKYYGTEDFNILNFIEYFEIAKSDMETVLSKSSDELPAYNINYLYGNDAMQLQYFNIRSAQ